MRRNKTRDVQIFGLIFGMMVVTSIPCSLAAGFSSDQACTDNERWQWDSRIIPQEIQTSYQSFLRGSLSPPRAFAEALSLRRVYRSNTPGVFSEYWISRAFYSAGLIHVAYQGLSTIAQREVPPEAAPILDAVFSCMNQIQKKAPGLSLNAEMIPSLVRLPKTVATRIAALKLTLDLLGGQDRAAIEQLLKYLADTGSTEYLSRGFSTALQSQHANTVQWLEKYIKNIPPALALYEVPARMILARAHFATGNFDGAIREYLLIPKESNEISKVLEELAWAYLRANKLKEAVGTTANLHSGGFKKTFAPESHFIMAITFNELCHYPEAIKAVNLFRRDYEATHAWLSQWKVDYDRKKGDLSPYDQIISHIKQKKIDVPIKVVNEWLRSPLFLSRQDHLNQLIREKDSVNQFNERAMKDGAAMAKDLLSFLKNFRPAYRKAKSQGAYGDPLPKAMLEDLELFKKKVKTYFHFKRAAGPWVKISRHFLDGTPGVRGKLVHQLNADLSKLNLRMLSQLNEVTENLKFLEVEVYQGASQDIIWQNAHPEFGEFAKKWDKERDNKTVTKPSWNWGKNTDGISGNDEVWEDELGYFRADLTDQCTSKQQYLNVQKNQQKKQKRGGSP